MATKTIKLYYDSYEKNFGDGFYPLITPTHGYTETDIQFKYSNGCWRQMSGDSIHGFDGNEKNILLEKLNENKICCRMILNKIGMTL
jgi:hypothetical protein